MTYESWRGRILACVFCFIHAAGMYLPATYVGIHWLVEARPVGVNQGFVNSQRIYLQLLTMI